MNEAYPLLHIIYLRLEDTMLISKKPYSHWREIQDEYEDYMTSLGPWSEEEVIDFLRADWGTDEARWPFSSARIHAFMSSNEQILPSISSNWDR